MQRRYVLPLYWSWKTTENGRFLQGRHKGWPFFDYTMQGLATKQFRTLSPLWFWRPNGGFERNYSDFWKLYQYRRWADGMKEHKILWYPWYSGIPDQEEGRQPLADSSEEQADSSPPSGSLGEQETGGGDHRPALKGLADQVMELNLW